MRTLVVVVALVCAGCGDDTSTTDTSTTDTSTSTTDTSTTDTSTTDTSPDVDSDGTTPTDPWVGLAGVIELVEIYSDGRGAVAGSQILLTIDDGVAPTRLVPAAADGDCRLWLQSTTPCAPCDPDESCVADGTCTRSPAPTSAGTITFTGLIAPLSARPTEPIPYYVFDDDPPSSNIFDAGQAITVTAAGDDGFPGFVATVEGVGDLQLGSTGLVELVDGEDFTLTWTPATSDATVEAVLQLGWHGTPPIARIVCSAPDAAGELTVPASIIGAFPYFQGGLFQVPSWIERLDRALVAGPYGPIEVRVASRAGLYVTHRAER